ncbi:phosphonate C-P lyase system protein PhnG [Caenispirillum salinarum]|nr:phosphonate C-P lyase system protein PhnG [Caenispirillum salinarum]
MTETTPTAPLPEVARRQRWMGILARTPLARLEETFAALPEAPAFTHLRRPEIGSALVRGRAGGSGERFNLGEMTVTRCSVRLSASGAIGHAYVAGRARRHAELAAVFDALLQTPGHHDRLCAALTDPAAEAIAAARAETVARTAATRVDFFTMVRGED